MSISEQIEVMINNLTDNNHPPQIVTITKAYNNNTADIITDNGILTNIPCSGKPVQDTQAMLTFNNGDMQNPYLILFEDARITIQALGLGEFYIKDDGILYVELPNGIENPFKISEGTLCVNLPEGVTNNYEIKDNDLYYEREVLV